MVDSLWGDDFSIEPTQEIAKKVIRKKKSAKEPIVVSEKILSSKKVSIEDKIKFITEKVHSILGTYKENTTVIRTKDELSSYIDKAIENGAIAVDTETNNSLQPVTCKLMGACIYTPSMKNAYIPVNHVNVETGELLPNQLTESDIAEQFSRLKGTTKVIMHNGKFDYNVIKFTCGILMDIYWDTIIAARLLNENEPAGLKEQYISKIDPSIDKYSIEGLFEGIPYEYFSPELFALYAATDAFMTYKLYLWQVNQFKKRENYRLFKLFMDIEMKVLPVTADMETTGVTVDKEYVELLANKFHSRLDSLDVSLNTEFGKFSENISAWRTTKEATEKKTKKDKSGNVKLDKNGNVEYLKSLSEQLPDKISANSPTQLSILFYDVLKCKVVDKKKPRGTGKDQLNKLKEEYKNLKPLIDTILAYKQTHKLLDTFVDKLPTYILDKTGRLHATFSQLGTDTGRYSSKDPNLQQIPSHEQSIRMMFVPQVDEHDICITDNRYIVDRTEEVLTDDGWKYAKNISIGDRLVNSDNGIDTVSRIEQMSDKYYLYV